MDNTAQPQVHGQIDKNDISYSLGINNKQLKDSFLVFEQPIAINQKDMWLTRMKDTQLKQEFKLLRFITETDQHQAELLYQKELAQFNRYTDIIPFRSRIPLVDANQNKSAFTAENYINACYIRDVYNFNKAYISSQGPLENSINNFWKMVFTNKCAAIVMLCKLEDHRGVQCAKYWPDHNKTFQINSNLKVTNQAVKKEKTFTYSQILIESGEQKHVCQHIQWEGWPDHGVPLENGFESISKLCDTINQQLAQKQSVTVHCSAGVGRTGTLIACAQLKQILDHYKNNQANNDDIGLSVFSIIRRMREQRICLINMVMHYEQYRFVYEYIFDQIKRFLKK